MTSTERIAYGNPIRVVLADGTDFITRVTNPDRLRWDQTAPRKGWGKAADVPVLAQTFITWAAAKRESLTELPFEVWQEQCVVLEDAAYDEETTVIRPTSPAATPAPSSPSL